MDEEKTHSSRGDNMNETKLKTQVTAMLKKEFPDIFFWKECNMFTSGIPDIPMCVPVHIGSYDLGLFAALELKIPGSSEPDGSKIQQYQMSRIIRAKGIAEVHKSVDEVRDFILRIKQIERNYELLRR